MFIFIFMWYYATIQSTINFSKAKQNFARIWKWIKNVIKFSFEFTCSRRSFELQNRMYDSLNVLNVNIWYLMFFLSQFFNSIRLKTQKCTFGNENEIRENLCKNRGEKNEVYNWDLFCLYVFNCEIWRVEEIMRPCKCVWIYEDWKLVVFEKSLGSLKLILNFALHRLKFATERPERPEDKLISL